MAEKEKAEGLREAFSVLRDIKESFGRIDERTKNIEDKVTKGHSDHEERIRKLEIKDAKRSGALAAVGSIAGAVGAGLMWLIKLLTGSN